MIRSISACIILFTVLLFTSAWRHTAQAQPAEFIIETVVAVDGGASSLALDRSLHPWIGYWTNGGISGGTMHFAVRGAGGWSFETVPIAIRRPQTATVIDAAGTPAVGYGDGHTLRYLYRAEGAWTTESIGGFAPNASALATDPAGRPFAAFVWSYHYIGYITVAGRYGETWDCIEQCGGMSWFNPPWAAVDIAVDRYGDYHLCVNPAWSEFYYMGPGTAGLSSVPYELGHFSIAADAHGQPAISFTENGRLSIISKSLAGWAMAEIADVTECTGTDLAIGGGDVPHIAFCQKDGGASKIFYAVRAAHGVTWDIIEVDGGRDPYIAVDGFGRVHIAYITQVSDPDGWDLRYATRVTSTATESMSWGEMKSLFGPKQNGKNE